MRQGYPEVKLPDKLKGRPNTLAMSLVGGMLVMLAMVLLV